MHEAGTRICAGVRTGAAEISPARTAYGAGEDARRAVLLGAGDEGRDRQRWLHLRRGRSAASRDGDVRVRRRRQPLQCDTLIEGMVARGYLLGRDREPKRPWTLWLNDSQRQFQAQRQ